MRYTIIALCGLGAFMAVGLFLLGMGPPHPGRTSYVLAIRNDSAVGGFADRPPVVISGIASKEDCDSLGRSMSGDFKWKPADVIWFGMYRCYPVKVA